MLTLALDTAADTGSIALDEDGHLLAQVGLSAPGGFGQTLFGELEALLAGARVRLADIDLYAASSGPGSFTGVRVGLAAVKGLADVAGKPALGISSLLALAQFGSAEFRGALLDARRGEVFAAVFDAEDNTVVPESVMTLAKFLQITGERPMQWITTGFDPGLPVTTAGPELAGMIARLALRRFKSGERCDPASIEANYVRRSDAEIFHKP